MSSVGENRFTSLNKILGRPGPFVGAGFDKTAGLATLDGTKILVVGAGGLGCEMLKDLALMGFPEIHVIDCDIIEVSNLNRQFLFRTHDVGKSKAETAAAVIGTRVPGCHVVPHFCKIEDKDPRFYEQFNVIVSGLDAIGPRRWLNATVFNLLEISPSGEMENIIPMVDGGTEGFKGNLRVIIPTADNPCMECTLDLFPPQVTYPMCTLTHRPRLPEHCIEYVRLVQWSHDRPFGDCLLDVDDPVHLQWIYERAVDRAAEYRIEGVTYRLTQGVIKNIIPAVASTNSAIAAACCTEVFKLMTESAPLLNNYMVFNDVDGIYTYTYSAERNPNCAVCGQLPVPVSVSRQATLKELIQIFQNEYDFTEPISVTTAGQTLYMASLAEQTGGNLMQSLHQLQIQDGQLLLASDRLRSKRFTVKFLL